VHGNADKKQVQHIEPREKGAVKMAAPGQNRDAVSRFGAKGRDGGLAKKIQGEEPFKAPTATDIDGKHLKNRDAVSRFGAKGRDGGLAKKTHGKEPSKAPAATDVDFSELDTSHSGDIDIEEMRAFLSHRKPSITEEQVQSIFGSMDLTGDGLVSREEFSAIDIDDILSQYSTSSKERQSKNVSGRSYRKSELGKTAAKGLKVLMEEGQTAEAVFALLDVDNSGVLDEEELTQGIAEFGTLLDESDIFEIKALLGLSQRKKLQVNLEQFKKIVTQMPAAAKGGTVTGAWLVQLHLEQVYIPLIDEYEYLPEAGDTASIQDKLAHVRGLQEKDVRRICLAATEKIVKMFMSAIDVLKADHETKMCTDKDASYSSSNDKFSGGAGGVMVYGDISEFHEGLESKIGLPNPRVFEGMLAEHCARADSSDDFTAWNYGITSTPRIEWEFVVCPDANTIYFGEFSAENLHGRTRQTIDELMAHPKIIKAKLSREELIALRLYTGPMFVKYNCILRGFPKTSIDGLKGNRYVTTLHAIVSGIRKMGRVEPIPEGRCVFRGLGGMILPSCFHEPNELGCMGGVERAFMSTTTKREIAIQYSGNKTPTIFQINIGEVDMGASLNLLSQYQGEEEILMPPLSNLEVSGPKWYENGCMVVPLRINVNLKSSTIDEIVTRRKMLHQNMLANLISEAKRNLEELSDSSLLEHGSVAQSIVKQAGINLALEYEELAKRYAVYML
jgi:Ca2+-binding EF-hand superfamily protein